MNSEFYIDFNGELIKLFMNSEFCIHNSDTMVPIYHGGWHVVLNSAKVEW
jgi:hypothetical protein